MSDTVFTSLLSGLKQIDIRSLAGSTGESEQSVSRGLEASLATLLSGLSDKAGDSNVLQKIVDLASKAPADIPASTLAQSNLSDRASPLLSGGKHLLSLVFSGKESAVVSTIGMNSNLRTGTASALMTVAAQALVGWIAKRIRDNGLTANGLGDILQKESASFRSTLPASFHDLFPTAAATGYVPPRARAVTHAPSRLPWLTGLVLAILVLGTLWYSYLARQNAPNRKFLAISGLGSFVNRSLPNGTTMNVRENGVESHLLAFIQDPNRTPDKTTWFDFDRLLFDTGSATLQEQSQEQLKNIASILRAYPNVRIKIGGYTDNVGDAGQNLKLSQDRADEVMAELVRLGIAQDRLAAQGYGENHPIADNSTPEGRAMNRRISMLIEQK